MTNETSTVPLAESAEDLAKRFAELAERWKREPGISSIRLRNTDHPACREIVAMGDKAIPFILADLEKNGGYWFKALKEITGADGIPNDAAAWLAWGREQGYRWEHAA
jgi:hypothetical protein